MTDRRTSLKLIGGGIAASALLPRAADAAADLFDCGVASGDPTQDGVIIWTRIGGMDAGAAVKVDWQFAKDKAMRMPVATGAVETDAARDFTVKIDVTGLRPGRTYYYRFTHGAVSSRIGRTKTLPAGQRLRLGVAACSNHPAGYFHAYADIATHDLDAVLHLGDYIYEYGLGGYASAKALDMGRLPMPPHKLETLDDYRRRYQQYRRDTDLQKLHASLPFICVWDDHEIRNGTYRDGSTDYKGSPDGFAAMRGVAIQAYHEYLPVRLNRANRPDRIFRSFSLGALGRLSMLDARHYARTPIPSRRDLANGVYGAEVLGTEQENWLRAESAAVGDAPWHLIGQQFLVSPFRTPDLTPLLHPEARVAPAFIANSKYGPILLPDSWAAYPRARQTLLDILAGGRATPVVLTGDIHTALAGDLYDAKGQGFGAELVCGSITSPGLDDVLPPRRPGSVAQGFVQRNAEVQYVDGAKRGWRKLDITQSRIAAQWHFVSTIHHMTFEKIAGAQFSIARRDSQKDRSLLRRQR